MGERATPTSAANRSLAKASRDPAARHSSLISGLRVSRRGLGFYPHSFDYLARAAAGSAMVAARSAGGSAIGVWGLWGSGAERIDEPTSNATYTLIVPCLFHGSPLVPSTRLVLHKEGPSTRRSATGKAMAAEISCASNTRKPH